MDIFIVVLPSESVPRLPLPLLPRLLRLPTVRIPPADVAPAPPVRTRPAAARGQSGLAFAFSAPPGGEVTRRDLVLARALGAAMRGDRRLATTALDESSRRKWWRLLATAAAAAALATCSATTLGKRPSRPRPATPPLAFYDPCRRRTAIAHRSSNCEKASRRTSRNAPSRAPPMAPTPRSPPPASSAAAAGGVGVIVLKWRAPNRRHRGCKRGPRSRRA